MTGSKNKVYANAYPTVFKRLKSKKIEIPYDPENKKQKKNYR